MATFPADSVRTKTWGTELLTSSDLHAQLDLLHAYLQAALDSASGHDHDGTSNQGPKLTPANLVIASQAAGDILYASSTTAWARLAKGTAAQVLKMNSGATAPEWGDGTTYASAAEVTTGTEAAKAVAPSTMVSHEGVCKGWINFNGTGTIAVNDSYNVSGITDNGTGLYTIAWDTDFGSANYALAGMAQGNGGSGDPRFVEMYAAPVAGSIQVRTANHDGTAQDPTTVTVLAIGDR